MKCEARQREKEREGGRGETVVGRRDGTMLVGGTEVLKRAREIEKERKREREKRYEAKFVALAARVHCAL